MDNASVIKKEFMNNQIETFFTSTEDLIAVWYHQQKRLNDSEALRCVSAREHKRLAQPCHVSHSQNKGQTFTGTKFNSRPNPTSYHAHGKVKQFLISNMDDLYDYITETVSFSKNHLAAYVSPMLDAKVLTRVTKDLGITAKMLPKEIRGYQYIAFTGYAGSRNILTSPIYKSNNIKLVNLAIGRLGVANSIMKGTILTLSLTIPLSIAESMLRKPQDLYYLFGYLATDIIKVGIQVLFVAILGLTAASIKTLALAPMGIVIVIGLGTGWALNVLDDKYRLTEKLISA